MSRLAIISAAFGLILLAACANTPPPSAARIIATPDRLLRFDRIKTRALPGELLVRGRVTKMKRFDRGRYIGRVPGHIHVEVFAGGTSLGWQDTRWRRFAHKPYARSSFTVRFALDPRRVDEVRVSYDPIIETHNSSS